MEGGQAGAFRQAVRRLDRAGATFRVADARRSGGSDGSSCARSSDDGSSSKAGAEKGFSLGSSTADYLARFPMAVIEQDGSIVAFANLWRGAA